MDFDVKQLEQLLSGLHGDPSELEPDVEIPALYKVTVKWPIGCNVRNMPSIRGNYLGWKRWGTEIITAHAETVDNDGSKWIEIADGEYISTLYYGSLRATVEAL